MQTLFSRNALQQRGATAIKKVLSYLVLVLWKLGLFYLVLDFSHEELLWLLGVSLLLKLDLIRNIAVLCQFRASRTLPITTRASRPATQKVNHEL